MQQLTGVDASFLYMESASTFGHVCSVSIFDPSCDECGGERLTIDKVRALVESRLHLLPPFRRRLAEVPFGLDRPYWVDDPDFDIDFHVRELALPAPGDKYQLAEQVSRIASRPLDRARPLWELYLIWGLEGDRVAMMAKFHHAAIDGVGGRELMTTLLDTTPTPAPTEPAPTWRPDPIPSDGEMLMRGLTGLATQPWKWLQLQQRVAAGLPKAAQLARQTATPALAGALTRMASPTRGGDGNLLTTPMLGAAPRLSFNRTITPHRRWAFGSSPLAQVKALKTSYGVTVNDVVMAMCAGGLRHWLSDHGELPDVPLLAMVPISVRTEASKGAGGNQVSAMVAPLPTHVADPVERLRAAHEAMRAAKEQFGAIDASVLADMTQFAMPAMAVRAARVASQWRVADLVNPPFNVVISNVPGPQTPLYLAGARMLNYYPVSVVTDGQGMNMTVQSYSGSLDFGLISCRELMPDLWNLMDYVEESLAELGAAAPDAEKNAAPRKAAKKAPARKATPTKAPARKATPKKAAARSTRPTSSGSG